MKDTILFSVHSKLLEACILAILKNEDSYGYKLTQDVKKLIPISESTLYPVLRRLQNSGALNTYKKLINGRTRNYYTITMQGKLRHKEHIQEWKKYKNLIEKILYGNALNDTQCLFA